MILSFAALLLCVCHRLAVPKLQRLLLRPAAGQHDYELEGDTS